MPMSCPWNWSRGKQRGLEQNRAIAAACYRALHATFPENSLALGNRRLDGPPARCRLIGAL